MPNEEIPEGWSVADGHEVGDTRVRLIASTYTVAQPYQVDERGVESESEVLLVDLHCRARLGGFPVVLPVTVPLLLDREMLGSFIDGLINARDQLDARAARHG